MGSKNPGDGVPKGDYRVYFLATAEYKFAGPDGNLYTGEEMSAKKAEWGEMGSPMPVAIPKIDSKYEASQTSGIECKITGAKVFDIKLEPAM